MLLLCSALFLPIVLHCNLDPDSLDLHTLLKRVSDAGIAGLGGATFPTATKLAGAAATTGITLVINGAECEPYISCDDMLMREQADQILLGAKIVMDTLGAQRALVAIERDKIRALETMSAAIERLGDPRFQLEKLFTIYPAGGERQLIQVLSGKEVPPVTCFQTQLFTTPTFSGVEISVFKHSNMLKTSLTNAFI